MTPLKKPVKRVTDTTVRDRGKVRRLVITVYPSGFIGLRPEATRKEELLSFDAAYSIAVKQRVARERAEKQAERKRKQLLKGKGRAK